jgi:hypothetical protein
MALPLLVTPEFTTKIPSTGQEIEYRPFLVKEEKILFMALESGEQKDIIKAVKNTLKSCILSEIDINQLASFDVEYLFLQLRSKSVNEFMTFMLGHENEEECDNKTEISIDIDSIKIECKDEDKIVKIDDKLGFKMKYPTIDTGLKFKEGSDLEKSLAMIYECIEFIFDEDNVYEDFTKEELEEFIEKLSSTQLQRLIDFFENMPKLQKKVSYKCKKCGKKEEHTFEGLNDFFS